MVIAEYLVVLKSYLKLLRSQAGKYINVYLSHFGYRLTKISDNEGYAQAHQFVSQPILDFDQYIMHKEINKKIDMARRISPAGVEMIRDYFDASRKEDSEFCESAQKLKFDVYSRCLDLYQLNLKQAIADNNTEACWAIVFMHYGHDHLVARKIANIMRSKDAHSIIDKAHLDEIDNLKPSAFVYTMF